MAKIRMKPIEWLAVVLLLVGGLNWGLVGLFQFNLVEELLNSINMMGIVKWVYGLVGFASVYGAWRLFGKK